MPFGKASLLVAFAALSAASTTGAAFALNSNGQEGVRGMPPSVVSSAKKEDGPANYGSYVTICGPAFSNVTFVNFPDRDCLGEASLYTMPLNQCGVELVTFSWNAFCNTTHMWYNNFQGTSCEGKSLLTRTYENYKCFNCPNKECKNPN